MLHQARHDLTEGAVAADAGGQVIVPGMVPGQDRGVAPAFGEIDRGVTAPLGKGVEGVCKALFIGAASRGGIDDQHELAFHGSASLF